MHSSDADEKMSNLQASGSEQVDRRKADVHYPVLPVDSDLRHRNVVKPSDAVQQQQPVMYPGQVTETWHEGIAVSYRSQQSVKLGIAFIIVGLLSFAFNGTILFYDPLADGFASIGHGFWCGILFIISGSVGIAAADKTRCLIFTFMVMSIVSSSLSLCQFGFGVAGAVRANYICRHYINDPMFPCSNLAMKMETLLASVAVVAEVVSIWGWVICCQAVSCCGYKSQVKVQAPYDQQQVLTFNPQQQPGVFQNARPQGMPMYDNSPAHKTPADYRLPQSMPVHSTDSSFQQMGNYDNASAPDNTSFG